MKKILIIGLILSSIINAGLLGAVDSLVKNAGSSEIKSFIIEEKVNGKKITCIVIIHKKFQKMDSHCFEKNISLFEKKKN